MIRSVLITAALASGFLTACTYAPSELVATELDAGAESSPRASALACAEPAFKAPSYPDWVLEHGVGTDGRALETLIDAAGYSPSSDWVDVAAGNFCGGIEKELVLVQNASPRFSILRGPVPTLKGTSQPDSVFEQAHGDWKAVAAADLDGDGYDELIAVRAAASGHPDVVIGKVNPTSCNLTTVYATHSIGVNVDWQDVAVGKFRTVSGVKLQEIVLVKSSAAYFHFLRFNGPTLAAAYTQNLGSNSAYPWRALAAGDLNGDGHDELIAARTVTDNVGTTVRAYRWDSTLWSFSLMASSTFGNVSTATHDWISAAAGNFGGDAREAVALVKDRHSNFVIMEYDGTAILDVRQGADLATQSRQPWRGLAATDWSQLDQGHDELIAIRSVTGDHKVNAFVYGSAFHRQQRDSGILDTKAIFAGNEAALVSSSTSPQDWAFFDIQALEGDALRDWIVATGANTYNVPLRLLREYGFLVELLEATQDLCVDGRQFRVWVNLVGWSLQDNGQDYRSEPRNVVATPFDDCDYFTSLNCAGADCQCRESLPGVRNSNKVEAWAALLGDLAVQYPHLVAVGFDDFLQPGNWPKPWPIPNGKMTMERLARMQTEMRSRAAWLSFVPTVYDANFDDDGNPETTNHTDTVLAFDSMQFYKDGPACGSVSSAEIDDMVGHLPAGRKLQTGVYFGGTGVCTPTVSESRTTLSTAASHPSVGGTTVYTGSALWFPNGPPADCSDPTSHDYCAVQDVYGE